MQSFMLSSKSVQFLKYMDLRTRTTAMFFFKSTHHSLRYERICEWVFFSEHSVDAKQYRDLPPCFTPFLATNSPEHIGLPFHKTRISVQVQKQT